MTVDLGDARLPQRIWQRITPQSNGCWAWSGRIDRDGYGHSFLFGQTGVSHRLIYRALVGDIAPGLELDHLCHTRDRSCAGGRGCLHRRCVNPAHLEPVTHYENGRRGVLARMTHWVNGHEFTPDNTYDRSHLPGNSGVRTCRACNRAAVARYKARRSVA